VTVAGWLAGAAARLREGGVEAPELEARALCSSALGWSKEALLARPDAEPSPWADALLERRLRGEPLAYVTGRREFYGRSFAVDPRVLIPRHETETLVEAAFALGGAEARVLDLCTGSGCVACTLALERPGWAVAASDVSEGAAQVARQNAADLGARVDIRTGDLAAPWQGKAFGLVVCNPPYVAEGAALPAEVGRHEPALALFAGPDGLAFYRRLAAEARPLLAPGGTLAVELGDGAADAVSAVFARAGWNEAGRARDLGGWERVAWFDP
jgi:release factor glutamine methyltransferase